MMVKRHTDDEDFNSASLVEAGIYTNFKIENYILDNPLKMENMFEEFLRKKM